MDGPEKENLVFFKIQTILIEKILPELWNDRRVVRSDAGAHVAQKRNIVGQRPPYYKKKIIPNYRDFESVSKGNNLYQLYEQIETQQTKLVL